MVVVQKLKLKIQHNKSCRFSEKRRLPELLEKVDTKAVTHSRPLPSDLPVMEQGQIEKVQLPPIVPGSDEDNLVKCLDELNINKITTQSKFSFT